GSLGTVVVICLLGAAGGRPVLGATNPLGYEVLTYNVNMCNLESSIYWIDHETFYPHAADRDRALLLINPHVIPPGVSTVISASCSDTAGANLPLPSWHSFPAVGDNKIYGCGPCTWLVRCETVGGGPTDPCVYSIYKKC